MTAIEGRDYCVRIVCLADGVHGCVSQDSSGFYNVYVNANDSLERQREALDHEVKKHIEGNDFAKLDVREIEGL
jgi:hypothetical protein